MECPQEVSQGGFVMSSLSFQTLSEPQKATRNAIFRKAVQTMKNLSFRVRQDDLSCVTVVLALVTVCVLFLCIRLLIIFK